MELLRCRARLSVLWVFMAVGTAAAMLLSFLKPGVIENVMSGEWGGMPLGEGLMVAYALFFLIPLLVAVLCLTLSGSANRWLNFILGIIWVLWFIFEIVQSAIGEAEPAALWLMLAAGILVSLFIAFFAWKLPEKEA